MVLRWICGLGLASSCAHRAPPGRELWVPADRAEHVGIEGREIWIDVEVSGYMRQPLERYSDYQAEHELELEDASTEADAARKHPEPD